MRALLFALPAVAFAFAAGATDYNGHTLPQAQRDFVGRNIYQSCYAKTTGDAQYRAAAAQLKTDIAKDYCTCMATGLSQQFTDVDMTMVGRTHHNTPHMDMLMQSQSKQCGDSALADSVPPATGNTANTAATSPAPMPR
ncbi:MAG: hypothetical protein WDN72_03185 [Alphaproteobacteria bacterium]